MTDRTNRRKSTNGEEWGSIENLGEYAWWGNGGIVGGWKSWVKYGRNIEGVGKLVGVWEEVREGVGRCVGVWEVVWGMGSRCVEVCLGCGEICWGVGRGVEKVLGWGQCEGRWWVQGRVGAGKGVEKGGVTI